MAIHQRICAWEISESHSDTEGTICQSEVVMYCRLVVDEIESELAKISQSNLVTSSCELICAQTTLLTFSRSISR
jgi:hypothetical protein